MGYASTMSSSFIYRPHVHQSDGAIVTPDILIERVYASKSDSALRAMPVSNLTSAAVLQQSDGAPAGTPAVVLVAASFGLLVSVGAMLQDALAIARAAWRYDDIGDTYEDITLRSRLFHNERQTDTVSEKLSALTAPADAMATLGNPAGLKAGTAVFIGHPAPLGESIPAERLELALESGRGGLVYPIRIETLG